MRFSQREVKDLFLAWILLSIAFAVLFTGAQNLLSEFFAVALGVSALTAGMGFLLHELAHKFVAQRYGLFAEFVAYYKMIFLAIGLAFFGFIFAAPGAVMIKGMVTRERNGKISVAGPVTNIVLAVLFLAPLLLAEMSGIMWMIFSFGFRINALLAVFNMIPVMPFDGAKVIAWDKTVFYIVAGIGILLFVGSFFI
jgi:Zn-dependent protease